MTGEPIGGDLSGAWRMGKGYFSYARRANRLVPMSAPLFRIEDLHVRTASGDRGPDGAGRPGSEILRGVDLTVGAGDVSKILK